MIGDKLFSSVGDEDLKKLEQIAGSKSGFSLSGFQSPVMRKRVWQFISNRQMAFNDFVNVHSREPSETAAWLYPGETQLFRDMILWKYLIDNTTIAFPEEYTDRILFFDCPTGEEYFSWEIIRHSIFPSCRIRTLVTTQLKSSASLIKRKQLVFRKVSSLPALMQNHDIKINILDLLVQKYNIWYLDFKPLHEPEIQISDCITPFPSNSFRTVFCRNRLIYYKESVCRLILSNLFRAIVPGGFLLAGTHDNAEMITDAGFRAFNKEQGIYIKQT